MDQQALQLAGTLRDVLQRRESRIVLAESCTAGRVAATLGCLPGISQWLCGSFVVYRCDSKTRWLGVPAELLEAPDAGPVSRPTTLLLARRALAGTPEASYGLAVTGDLGPGAPVEKDGVVYCAVAGRDDGLLDAEFHLTCPAPNSNDDTAARAARLDEATRLVLDFASQSISNWSDSSCARC